MQQSTHFLGVANKKILWQSKQMNIKNIVVFIAFCGFSTGLHTLPVPHIVVHKPQLVGLPAYVQIAAKKSGLSPKLIKAVIYVESRGEVKVVSSTGAIGPMQLEPATAKSLDVNPYNPKQNIEAGSLYLAHLIRQFGNIKRALIAYNEGPTALAEGQVCAAAERYAVNVTHYESIES